MEGIHIDQDLFMRHGAEFENVGLIEAHVGGQLDMSGYIVTGELNMTGLQAKEVFLSVGARFGKVILRGVHIDGQINLSGLHGRHP